MKREKCKKKICAERMMKNEQIMKNDVNMCFLQQNSVYWANNTSSNKQTDRHIDSDTVYD